MATGSADTSLPPSETHLEVYDLLVVGGGTAGIVAAKTAARFGARVVLVERDRTGGDCLWTGCVPSKALLAAAEAAASARAAGRLGVDVSDISVDFARVLAHVRAAITEIEPIDSPAALEAEGVTVRHGTATFTGPRTAEVDGETISFRQAVIATGAAPAVPPIPGLDTVDHLTSDTVWGLDRLPERLVVIGGGSIGCELGQAFARLGSDVVVIEGESRVLPREDADASALIHRALESDGVRVVTGHDVVSVEAAETGGGTVLLDGHAPVAFDTLLVAVGRRPRTAGIGLEKAGVAVDDREFVVVDRHLRTSNHRIWAAGDLTGHPQFTHVAGVHGSLAATNAVLGLRRSIDDTVPPRVTFTQPEVAAVGEDTDGERDGVHVVTLRHERVDRGVTEQRTDGFTKIAVDRRGRVVGATIVGPRAGESIGELALAVRRGVRTRDLAGVIHPYPTYNDGVWNAAIADVRDQLERPTTRRVTSGLVRARRWLRSRGGERG